MKKIRNNRLLTILMALLMSVFSVPNGIDVLADTVVETGTTSTTTSIHDMDLWNNTTNDFNYNAVQQMLNYISMSNDTASTYLLDTIYDRARVVTTNDDFWTYFVGADNVSTVDKTKGYFTIGGLKWYPTYLSNDKNGDPVLTLWLAQDELSTATLNITEEKYVYGTSTLRSSVIANSSLSLFTDSTSGLLQYIDTPSQMDWQEYQSVSYDVTDLPAQDMASYYLSWYKMYKDIFTEDTFKEMMTGETLDILVELVGACVMFGLGSHNNDAWSTNIVGSSEGQEFGQICYEIIKASFELKLSEAQTTIDTKASEIESLKGQNNTLTTHNKQLKSENESLQAQIEASVDADEKSTLQAQIDTNNTTISNNESTISTNTTSITTKQSEIDDINENMKAYNEMMENVCAPLFENWVGADKFGNLYNFIDVEQLQSNMTLDGVLYQDEVGYDNWKNDYVWLPSITEVGTETMSVYGLWDGVTSLVSSNNKSNTILRSANHDGYASINATGDGLVYYSNQSEEANVNIRPAFNLNLGKVIDACVDEYVENSGQDEAKEYVASMTQFARIGELWDSENKTFNEDNLNKLYSYISGSLDASYETVESMLTSEKTYYDAQDFKSQTVTGLKYNHQNILVRIGGYDWHVMYMSNDTSDNPTLTLWMANSFNAKDIHKRVSMSWFNGGLVEGAMNAHMTFSSDNGIYGGSALSVQTLNNGGALGDVMSGVDLSGSKWDTDENGTYIFPKDSNSIYSLFTCEEFGFTDYITTPRYISWQENAQHLIVDGSQYNYQYGNESWSNNDIISNTGEVKYDTNSSLFASNWADDLLWVPSFSEVANFTSGDSEAKGIWNSSVEQLRNYDCESDSVSSVMGSTSARTMLRSIWWYKSDSSSTGRLAGIVISSDGSSLYNTLDTVSYSFIRPAMHLNLGAINETMGSGAAQGLVNKTTTLEYTGLDRANAIEFTFNKKALTYGTDYTLVISKIAGETAESVSSMVEVGSYKVNFALTASSDITLGDEDMTEFTIEIIPQTIRKSNISVTQKPILNEDYSLEHYEADIIVMDSLGNAVASSSYTVTYSNNTTANSTADVHIEFSGNYAGSYDITFATTVTPLSQSYDDYKMEIMSGETIYFEFDGSANKILIPDFTYDGNAHKLTFGKVYFKGTLLTEGVDYYYQYKIIRSYADNLELSADADESNFIYSSNVWISLIGIGKYASINDENLSTMVFVYNIKGIDISDQAEVTMDTNTFEWDNTNKCPKFTIKYNDVTYVLDSVVQEVEGGISYGVNAHAYEPGDNHQATITMKTPMYNLTKEISFAITKINLKDAALSKTSKTAFAYYNGEAPKLNITLERQKDDRSKNIVIKFKEVTTSSGEEGTHSYTFSVEDIEDVTIDSESVSTFEQYFTGTIDIDYMVVGSGEILDIDFGENGLTFEYDGTEKCPEPTITNTEDSSALTKGTDYNIAYYNNTDVNDNAYLEIVFQGKYRGTYKYNITLKPIEISKCTVFFTQNEFIYGNSTHVAIISVKYVNSAGVTIDKTFNKETPINTAGTHDITFDDSDFGPNYTGTYSGIYTINRIEITEIAKIINVLGDEKSGYYNYYVSSPNIIGVKFKIEESTSITYWLTQNDIASVKFLRDGVETTDKTSLGTIEVQLSGDVGLGYVILEPLSFIYKIKPNYVSNVYVNFGSEDNSYSGQPLRYYVDFISAKLVSESTLDKVKVSERDYWSVAFYKYENGSVVGEPLSLDTIANAGTYRVIVSGTTDEYTGSAQETMTIARKDINSLYGIRYFYTDKNGNFVDQYGTITSEKTIVNPTDKLYRGIIFSGEISGLTLGTDYSVKGEWVEENNSYKVTLTGLHNYARTNTLTLNVEPKNIGDEDVCLVTDFKEEGYTYTGNTDDVYRWFALNFGTKTLVKDIDIYYTFSSSFSANVGSYTVKITGIQNFTGTKTYSYQIVPKSIQDGDITIEYSETLEYYEGIKLDSYTLKRGDSRISSSNYSVTVNEEGNQSTSVVLGTNRIVIRGMGNYTGQRTFTRTVTKGTFVSVAPVDSKVDSVAIDFDTKGKTEEDIMALFKFKTRNDNTIPTSKLNFEYYIWNNESGIYVPFNGYGLRFFDVGKYKVVATAEESSNYTGTQTFYFEISAKDIEPFVMLAVEDDNKILFARSWTGSQITIVNNDFSRLIYDGDYSLVAGIDFTYVCTEEERIDLGIYGITLTGIGNYTGTVEVKFIIEYDKKNIRLASIDDVTYTGSAITPKVTIMYNNIVAELVEGKDYDVMYTNNINAGRAEVGIISRVEYLNSENLATSFNILPRSIGDKDVCVAGAEEHYTYNCSAIKPTLVFTYNKMTLVENADYTVAYGENISAGEGSITIAGKGNYGEVRTITFTIDPKSIVGLVTIADISDITFTDNEIKPEPSLTFTAETLEADTDYEITYADNTNVGNAKYIITGKGNYSGEITKIFTITAKEIGLDMLSGVSESYTYTGSAIAPTVTMKFGAIVMTLNTDYTVAYSNNTNVGIATITVTGTGNYSGEITKIFTITAKEIGLDMLSGVESSYTYTGSEIKPSVVMTFNSNTMTIEVDYTVVYTSNTNVGKATITIAGAGNYSGEITKTFAITKAMLEVSVELVDKNVKLIENDDLPELKATVSGNVSGTVEFVKKDEKLFLGKHEYEWIFVPEDMSNYDIVRGTIVLEAEKSNLMFIVIIAISLLILLIFIILIIIIIRRNKIRKTGNTLKTKANS